MDHLYALDPATGKPIASFGEGGSVDLRKDLGNEDFASNFAVLTTPGTIYKDMIIVGFRAPETHPAPHGDIRAYDVHTGKLRWSFHTIPHPGEPGYETWPKDAWKTAGSANNWAGMVVDQKRGIVFAPTGSAVDDFYGADRVGNDLYANTLLALDANTGKRIWHFQGVHHDIWDRDFPSPPVLVTVKRDGKSIDAVAQTTKQGFVYLFERTTGKPLFPIEEKPYPASDCPRRSSLGHPAAAACPGALCPSTAHRRHADQPHARGARLGGRAVQQISQRRAVRSLSALARRRSSFPATTAARSGAARRSIPARPSSTSTRTMSRGPAAWPKTSPAAAPASTSTKANARSATATIEGARRRNFLL